MKRSSFLDCSSHWISPDRLSPMCHSQRSEESGVLPAVRRVLVQARTEIPRFARDDSLYSSFPAAEMRP